MTKRSGWYLPPDVGAAVGSRQERASRWLLGSRVSDLPVRALALIYAGTGLLPGASDGSAPLYLCFFAAAHLLYLAAAFAPLGSGVAGFVLNLLFTVTQHEYVNPFSGPMVFAAAVLLVRFRYRETLAVSAATLAATFFEHQYGNGVAIPYTIVFFDLFEKLLVAAAASAGVEMLRRETHKRILDARLHEKQQQDLRIRLAIDTHDTVSHGLARQQMLVRMLSGAGDDRSRRELLLELSLANQEIHAQLRLVLRELQSAPGPTSAVTQDPAVELLLYVETLLRAAEASGAAIAFNTTLEPGDIPERLLKDAKQAALELVTNITKHSALPGQVQMSIRLAHTGQPFLEFRTSNVARPTHNRVMPGSLRMRAEALGGSCVVARRANIYEVRVTLPLQLPDSICSEDAPIRQPGV